MLEFILSHISVQNLMWLIIGLPLAGFIVNGIISLVTAQYDLTEPRGLAILISQTAAVAALAATIVVWYILYSLEGTTPSVITGALFSWKGFVSKPLAFGLKADQLSLSIAFIMALVGVATHIYSVGFIAKQKYIAGYFSLLNLIFALSLLLILTDSLFLFFAAWQFVGIVGIVFISRNFSDEAGIKEARVYYAVEALSSAALLLVMILIWKAFLPHTSLDLDIFQFNAIQVGASFLVPYANVICFSLLVCLVARSLQFPLYVWLPGSSRVPLPVFTFVYAVSTVLVAIYILIRLNFILILSPEVLRVMAAVGGIGAIFGAASATVQTDIKKIMSYFVVSQVGLAFAAVGVGAFATTVFFIFTYATYITCILFGLGSVISITGISNINELSGLRKRLPVTFWVSLVGVLAAVGIYPFAGFFSKNGILWEVYQRGHALLFLCTFLAGVLGAIALFRMIALIFFGRRQQGPQPKMEESSVSMLVSMVFVAFASIVVGWFGVSEAFGGADHFRKWLSPGLATQMVHMMGEKGRFSELVVAVVATLVVAHAGFITWIIYVQKRRWPASLAEKHPHIAKLLENGFYLNSFYKFVLVKPLNALGEWVLWRGLDSIIIDGVLVDGMGRMAELKGEIINKLRVRSMAAYILLIVIGLVAVVGWAIF